MTYVALEAGSDQVTQVSKTLSTSYLEASLVEDKV